MSTDKENQKKQSEQTEDKNKNKNKDISNSLENDAVGEFGSNNPTPQARTDQEQDNKEQKNQK